MCYNWSFIRLRGIAVFNNFLSLYFQVSDINVIIIYLFKFLLNP